MHDGPFGWLTCRRKGGWDWVGSRSAWAWLSYLPASSIIRRQHPTPPRPSPWTHGRLNGRPRWSIKPRGRSRIVSHTQYLDKRELPTSTNSQHEGRRCPPRYPRRGFCHRHPGPVRRRRSRPGRTPPAQGEVQRRRGVRGEAAR